MQDIRIRTLIEIQSTLGFATLDKAAALVLATSRAVTDLRQYINATLEFAKPFSNLKISTRTYV